MKKFLLFFSALCLLTVNAAMSQHFLRCATIDARVWGVTDTTVCGGKCMPLSFTAHIDSLPGTNSYRLDSVPYAPYSYTIGTALTMPDDAISGNINIPFTFRFYGASYNQLKIAANGSVTFNLNATGSNWPAFSLPASPTVDTRNAIFGSHMDLYRQGNVGFIYYGTIGVYPCRKFIVSWFDMPFFSCFNSSEPGGSGSSGSSRAQFQIVLHEGVNEINVNIERKDNLSSCTWASGYCVVGIRDANTNNAAARYIAVPGKNGSASPRWGIVPPNQKTYVFIPNEPAQVQTYYFWYENNITNPPIATTQNATVCPFQTTNYIAEARFINSSNDTLRVFDTVRVNTNLIVRADYEQVIKRGCTHDTVNFIDRSLFAESYLWDFGDGTTSTLQTPPPHIYPTQNVYNVRLIITRRDCADTIVRQLDLRYDSEARADFDYAEVFGCKGDTVYFNNLSFNSVDFRWSFGDGTSSTDEAPIHYYPNQGTYTVRLIASDKYCRNDTLIKNINLVLPRLEPSFTVDHDTICVGQSVNLVNTSVATNPRIYWNSGLDGVISYDNNNIMTFGYGNPGIYEVTLVVEDYRQCRDSAKRNIYVSDFEYVTVHDTTVCLRDSMAIPASFSAKYINPDVVKYVWRPNAFINDDSVQNPKFFAQDNKTHVYVATVLADYPGCIASDIAIIHARNPNFLVNVTADQTIPYGSSVRLNASNGVFYTWLPSEYLDNPNISYPTAKPLETTQFTVFAMDEYGCRDTGYVNITVDMAVEAFIPSAFSPNGDGKNDVFRVVNLKYQRLAEMRIFNRWGEQLYYSTDGERGWDGMYNGVQQDQGTYNYIIRLQKPGGELKTYIGEFTLVR